MSKFIEYKGQIGEDKQAYVPGEGLVNTNKIMRIFKLINDVELNTHYQGEDKSELVIAECFIYEQVAFYVLVVDYKTAYKILNGYR